MSATGCEYTLFLSHYDCIDSAAEMCLFRGEFVGPSEMECM